MRATSPNERASGLIVALSILAMLAIMATTFITLMRLDTRVTRNYTDDQRCEMLAYGMLSYFKALLRDDIDRTWGKYENRDTGVGYQSYDWNWSSSTPKLLVRIPGFYEYSVGNPVADETRGTPVSNDFWFSTPFKSWSDTPGNLYSLLDLIAQQSFACQPSDHMLCRVGCYWDAPSRREYNVWIAANGNCWDSQGRTVSSFHPDARIPIDDDGDGVANPPFDVDIWTPTAGALLSWNENHAIEDFYYDTAPFVIFSGPTYLQPGSRLTGEATLPGGLFWRWGVKVGPTHSAYANLNTTGNVDGTGANSQGVNAYLNNMGGLGLLARRAYDERASLIPSEHLGRIEWRGFPGEYECQVNGGFPAGFNNVMYAPAAANLEKLFACNEYTGAPPPSAPDWDRPPNVGAHRETARELIRYRWGNGTGIPADGTDRWRVGWRRDGGSYYKFPSPENPMGSDRYFGANEVIEHDHSVDHPDTSVVARIMAQDGRGDLEWFKLRPHLTMWSTDTILRGKIWPTEGRLPWRPGGGTVGDWRHMDILKRVNINIIGAKGPEGLAGEDTTLKTRWAQKAARERDRLYFMLVTALRFTNTPLAEHEACQFIASLIDTVDRDRSETLYVAPDGTGNWALGVEKHPVINEAVFYSNAAANTASYQLSTFRVELYNPMENIPWIPDAEEAYDISNYVLRVGTHDYRLGDLVRYGSDPSNTNGLYSDGLPGNVNGAVRWIGADGMYGYPQAAGVTSHPTWSRYVHLGWPGGGFPPGLTRGELEGTGFSGLQLSLWKPLSTSAADGNPAGNLLVDGVRVDMIGGVKCICVDATDNLKLVRPYGTANPKINGPGGNQLTYVGTYRRWDSMNPKIYGTQTVSAGMVADVCDQQGNVLWVPGKTLANYPTLGRPNNNYPSLASSYNSGYYINYNPSGSPGNYDRRCERNFKVVDGDLPSIGWLGELIMRNCAQDGPLPRATTRPQQPSWNQWNAALQSQSELDWKGKFDLCCPFLPAVPAAGKYKVGAAQMNSINLPVLDMFTTWDPSNDGIDNDGDGAIDDDDTGLQDGDRCGPEVRVFGKIDINMVSPEVMTTVFPDDDVLRRHGGLLCNLWYISYAGRSGQRMAGNYHIGYGPFETIGDFMRVDTITPYPGALLCGMSWYNFVSGSPQWTVDFGDGGIASGVDDDGDGVIDERDERDMIFTWISNHFTTRDNVFEVDINAQTCSPPFYPGRKLPYPVYKTKQAHARKQLIGILDRSTILRVASDGRCDFTGPVEVRMLRMTDDLIVY